MDYQRGQINSVAWTEAFYSRKVGLHERFLDVVWRKKVQATGRHMERLGE
jgi:hypothetical protein